MAHKLLESLRRNALLDLETGVDVPEHVETERWLSVARPLQPLRPAFRGKATNLLMFADRGFNPLLSVVRSHIAWNFFTARMLLAGAREN
jgi:hypothetical protein